MSIPWKYQIPFCAVSSDDADQSGCTREQQHQQKRNLRPRTLREKNDGFIANGAPVHGLLELLKDSVARGRIGLCGRARIGHHHVVPLLECVLSQRQYNDGQRKWIEGWHVSYEK